MAIITSAVLASNYPTVVQSIYAFEPQNVTVDTDLGWVMTPEPMISSELQTQIWALGGIGVFIGAGLAIFLLFFKK